MKPKIEKTKFGSITIDGEKYEHDVIIRPDGKITKRRKKLSKEIFGTSHIISLAEAIHIYQSGVRWIIIGTGQSGIVKLSDEAAQFFQEQSCNVVDLPTPEAVRCWNEIEEVGIGLFHVTC